MVGRAALSFMTAHLDLSYHFLFVCLSQSLDFTLTDDVTEVWNNTDTHTSETQTHTVVMMSLSVALTDEVDTVFWSPQLLDQMFHILLQSRKHMTTIQDHVQLGQRSEFRGVPWWA